MGDHLGSQKGGRREPLKHILEGSQGFEKIKLEVILLSGISKKEEGEREPFQKIKIEIMLLCRISKQKY